MVPAIENAVPDVVLDEQEICKITGYMRAKYQLRVFKEMGIPARRRPDNTVLVFRMHCVHPAQIAAAPQPKVKFTRK